jgi:hypothetical protein
MPSGSNSCAANGNITCSFTITNIYEKSTNIANNTSVVHIDFSCTCTSDSYHAFSGSTRSNAGYLKVWVDGNRSSRVTIPMPNGMSGGDLLGSGSAEYTVTHNDDGTKSITYGITMDQGTDEYGASYYWQNTDWYNATMNLTTLPRTSNISLSSSSVILNGSSSVVINTNRKSSSFTHKIQQNFSGSFENLATGVGSSYTWVPPTDWYSVIGNGSKAFTIRLITYSGSTQIGYTDASFTVTSAGISPASLSTASITLNGSNGVTIYTNKKSSSFTHTIQQNFSGTFVDIATGVVDSTSWAPPTSYYSRLGGDSKNFTIRCITYSGSTLIGQVDKSFTLNSAGADAVSLSNSNMTMGTAYTVSIAKKITAFRHTVTWVFKSASGTLGTEQAVDTSVGWTPATSLAAQITTSMSATGTVTCQTFYGTTSIGSTSVNFTLSVPTYNVVLGTPTITEEGVNNSTDKIALTTYGIGNTEVVAIMSVKRLVVSASTSYNATISNISVTFGGATKTSSGSSFNNTFSGMLNGTLSITATDSRGRALATTYTQSYTFRNYFLPSVTAFSGDREPQTGDTGTLNASGTFWNATAGTTANTLTGAISKSATGTTTIVPKTNNTWSTSFAISGVTYTSSYDFTITVTDSFGNKATKNYTLSASVPVMWKGKHTVRIRDFLIVGRIIKAAKGIFTESVTAPTFNGALNGNATSATVASKVTGSSASSSWVNGRDNAFIKQLNPYGYEPGFSQKTNDGSWEIGIYSDDGNSFNIAHVTDSDYNAGINRTTATFRFGTDGSFSGSNILLQAWPVGSIYLSLGSTSPASLFGGTWTKLTNRFLVGAGDLYTINSTGGEATVTLTSNQIAPHTHGQTTIYSGSIRPMADIVSDTSSSGGNKFPNNTGGYTSATAILTTQSSGGGQAHNNMPPYLAVYMWERTA